MRRMYVVSSTLERADWSDSAILSGDIATEVTHGPAVS
jgi:hypothetical protein